MTAGLDAAGVAWERAPRLVRGLDYYRHTAFEFVTDKLGAQGTVLAGGRYDGLIESLGGPHTPAVGWAAGIERLAMMIDAPEARAADDRGDPGSAELRRPKPAQGRSAAAPKRRRSRHGLSRQRETRADEQGECSRRRSALIIGDDELHLAHAQVKDLRERRAAQTVVAAAGRSYVEALSRDDPNIVGTDRVDRGEEA